MIGSRLLYCSPSACCLYGVRSKCIEIICRVPQGSTVGLVMVIKDVNEIVTSKVCKDSTTLSFDDNTLAQLMQLTNPKLGKKSPWHYMNQGISSVLNTQYLVSNKPRKFSSSTHKSLHCSKN